MASSDTFYIDSENAVQIKEHTKKRGDKSKIVNSALKEYFLPKQTEPPTTTKTTSKEVSEVNVTI